MDIAVLNVRFTGDTSGMDRAFSSAQRSALNFKKTVSPLTNISFTADVSGFVRGMDTATASSKQMADSVIGDFRRIRTSASRGVTFTVDADTSSLVTAKQQVDDFASSVRAAGDKTINVRAVTSGLEAAQDGLNDLDRTATMVNAKWGSSVHVHAEVDGVSEGVTQLRLFDDEADKVDGRHIASTVDVDTLGGTAKLSAYLAYSDYVDAASDVHTNVDVDMGVAVAELGAYNATSATTTTLTNVMGAGFARSSAFLMILAGAAVIAMASIGPLLGAITVLGALGAGAGAGLGLIAGAIYALTQAGGDLGVQFGLLQERLAGLQTEFQIAFEPAAALILPIGYAAADVASTYIPLLGVAAMTPVFMSFFNMLNSQAGQSLLMSFVDSAAQILPVLTAAALNAGVAILAMLQPAIPYAIQLAQYIYGVVTALAAWATSAEGAAQITTFIEMAIPVFQALWNMVISVGGALLNFAMVAGGDVATTFNVLTTIVTAVIDGLTWLYETVGGAGIAFGLLAAAITPIVTIGFLATGAIMAFVAAAWPVAAVAAAIAVAATLIYNNWGPITEFLSSIWPPIQAAIQGFLTWLQTTWATIWAAIGPTVTTALTAVLAFITQIGTQIVTWWNTYFGPSGTLGLTWSGLWTGIQTVLSTAFMVLQTLFTTFVAIVTAIWTATWPGFVMVVQGAWTIIQAVIQAAVLIVQGIITAWAGLLTGNWQMLWDGLVMILQGVWTLIQGVVTGAVQIVLGIITEGWGLLSTVTTEAWNILTTVISAAWDGIYSVTSSVLSSISAFISSSWEAISTEASTIWNAIWTTIESIWNSIYTTISTWITSVQTFLTTTWTAIQTEVETIWNTIWTSIDTWWSSINDTVTSWLTTVMDFMQTTWDTISAAVETAWNAIWTTIDTWWSSISDTVTSWTTAITDAIQATWDGIVSGAESFGQLLYDTLYDGFWTAVSGAGEALASLLDGIQAAIDAVGIDIGVDVGGAAASIRELTAYAKGGLAIPVSGFCDGGMAQGGYVSSSCRCPGKDTATAQYARGGIGTNTPNARVHMWNEQMGNEAYIAQRGPRAANIGYLMKAADWFNLAVVPGGKGRDRRGSRNAAMTAGRPRNRSGHGFAKGGLAAFEYGGYLGGTHYDWTPEVAQIVSQISGATGGCGTPNTYHGHDYIGSGDDGAQSVDWWGGARGSQLDIACGDSIWAEGQKFPQLTYEIWQGIHSGLGPFPEDPHYDHCHQTFAGGGMFGGFFCKAIKATFQAAADAAKALAHTAMDAITNNTVVKGFGDWGIDTGIQAIIDYILSLLPACSGMGGAGGDCAAAIPAAVKQLGASDEFLSSMQSLGMQESGMDMGAINDYDSNAAAGTPSTGCWQMIPSTFQAWAEPDCTDINDPLCQAMSSINYQNGRYGGPVWNAPYALGGLALPTFHEGGVVSGNAEQIIKVTGGERVLTQGQNENLEALVNNPAIAGNKGANNVGGNQSNDMSTNNENNITIEVHVEGSTGSGGQDTQDLAKQIGDEAGKQFINIMSSVNTGSVSNKRNTSRGFS